MVRSLMSELRAEMAELHNRIATYDRRIRKIFRTSKQRQRLGKIEGIGPVTATALIAVARTPTTRVRSPHLDLTAAAMPLETDLRGAA
jgi:transposase